MSSKHKNGPTSPRSIELDIVNESSAKYAPIKFPLLKTTPSVKNFNNTFAFTPYYVAKCASVNDVRSTIINAVASGKRVRAMGSGYSWAPYLKTPGICLQLNQLNKIHEINVKHKTITADAGARLGDISRALAAHGLSLPSLSFFPEITIGGAVSTGTHGSSAKWGTLSDFIRSIHVVLASGEVRVFNQDKPEELCAARNAVGMLGVIVKLELQAANMPWVHFSELKMDLTAFQKQLPQILEQYDHVWAHWTLGKNHIRLECLKSAVEPTEGFHRYVNGPNVCWRPPPSFGTKVKGKACSLTQRVFGNNKSASNSQYSVNAFATMQTNNHKVWTSMQYGVLTSKLNTAIGMIQASNFAQENTGRVIELKFLKSEGLSYLGPNADSDVVFLNMWWLVDETDKDHVFKDFEQIMLSLSARPHWGKLHTSTTIEYLQRAYPQWKEFESIRRKLDPQEVFSIF